MKPAYPSERIVESNWKVEGIKKEIPTYLIKPINNSSKKVLIYLPGLNGNGCLVKYFNYPCFDNIYLFSFDQRAQAANPNKASRFYKTYLKDLNKIINTLKEKYPEIEEIHLCGESWGSTLAFLFSKYYPSQIKSVFGWNMPYDVIDISPIKGWTKVKNSLKVLLTFLTSINTYDEAPMADALTNNKLLIRIVKTMKNNRLNNKVTLACWRSLKKSWKVLKNPSVTSKYVQSLEDALLSPKRLEMIKNIPYVEIFEKGYHILTFDDNVSDKLFFCIADFIL